MEGGEVDHSWLAAREEPAGISREQSPDAITGNAQAVGAADEVDEDPVGTVGREALEDLAERRQRLARLPAPDRDAMGDRGTQPRSVVTTCAPSVGPS
jgi:hypothetical protein